MTRTYGDLDVNTLSRAAAEALTRPSDSAWFDDRLFHSHGCVWTWADRSDDILAESNYQAVLEALQGIVADESNDCEPEDVLDISASHWLVGSVRHIFVSVRNHSGEEFSPVFVEATKLALFVREQYPILDESDYSEREWKAYEADQDTALDDVKREHSEDTSEEESAITERFYVAVSEGRFDTRNGSEGADWKAVKKGYDEIRDEFFGGRAQDFLPYLASDVPAVHPDQSTLL